MKILCIGEALIDMICTDKGMTLSEGSNFLKKTGGAPTNVAAAIAALGGTVDLAAKVGKDPFGKQLIQTMESFGVGTKAMLEDPHHFTTFAFVSLMHDGERDFVFNRGADGQLSIDDVDAINLNNVGIIHFGSATGFLPGPLQAAYLHLLEKALHHKILISFDPNYRHLLFPNNTETFVNQSWHFLRNCNFFKVSDEEAMLLTNTHSLQEATAILLKETSGVFTITLGKDGTLLGLNGQQYIIESIPIKPVDTTGAGDAFVGAVLYQLSHLEPSAIQTLSLADWNKIILNANKAGARTCEYMGAMEAFKYLNNQIFK
ncbi:carbohydrate kinase family protein [Sediminibacterium sp.]|uniref:carbohydrate kinase family protein n=1 Tax=Sediminibacterium sp. TaxID=1917865 RepID=UPI003F6F0F8C